MHNQQETTIHIHKMEEDGINKQTTEGNNRDHMDIVINNKDIHRGNIRITLEEEETEEKEEKKDLVIGMEGEETEEGRD